MEFTPEQITELISEITVMEQNLEIGLRQIVFHY